MSLSLIHYPPPSTSSLFSIWNQHSNHQQSADKSACGWVYNWLWNVTFRMLDDMQLEDSLPKERLSFNFWIQAPIANIRAANCIIFTTVKCSIPYTTQRFSSNPIHFIASWCYIHLRKFIFCLEEQLFSLIYITDMYGWDTRTWSMKPKRLWREFTRTWDSHGLTMSGDRCGCCCFCCWWWSRDVSSIIAFSSPNFQLSVTSSYSTYSSLS